METIRELLRLVGEGRSDKRALQGAIPIWFRQWIRAMRRSSQASWAEQEVCTGLSVGQKTTGIARLPRVYTSGTVCCMPYNKAVRPPCPPLRRSLRTAPEENSLVNLGPGAQPRSSTRCTGEGCPRRAPSPISLRGPNSTGREECCGQAPWSPARRRPCRLGRLLRGPRRSSCWRRRCVPC